jgi:hypothetical protein
MRRAKEKAAPGDDQCDKEAFVPPLDPVYETK